MTSVIKKLMHGFNLYMLKIGKINMVNCMKLEKEKTAVFFQL